MPLSLDDRRSTSGDQQIAKWSQLLAQLATENEEEAAATALADLLNTIPGPNRPTVLCVTVLGLGQALRRLAAEYAALPGAPPLTHHPAAPPRLRRR